MHLISPPDRHRVTRAAIVLTFLVGVAIPLTTAPVRAVDARPARLIPPPPGDDPTPPASVIANGEPVDVEALPVEAAFTSDLVHTQKIFGFTFRWPLLTNHDTGRVISLGERPMGSEVVFELYVRDTDQTFRSGPGDRNPDGLVHARVTKLSPTSFTIGFEDTLGGGDNDFNDAVFQVRMEPLTPVIFIPGVTGSKLDGGGENLWLGGVLTDHRKLTLDPAKSPLDVEATDALRKYSVAAGLAKGEVYQPLLSYLAGPAGYREYLVAGDPARRTLAGCDLSQAVKRPTLFVFAYDWRKDIGESAALLREYVDCIRSFYPDREVNILAHSMGGLVARRYLLDNPGGHHVDRLVTIATPWLGAPKLIHVMETGDFDLHWALLLESTLRNLVRHFPGVHELAPGRAFVTLGGQPLRERGWDLNGNGIDVEDYDFDAMVALLDGRYGPAAPGSVGRDFHDVPGQDDWRSDTSGARFFHAVGRQSGAATIGTLDAVKKTSCLIFGRFCSTRKLLDTVLTVGDSTVPEVSAARTGAGEDLNAAGALLRVFEDGDVSHVGLTKNPKVHAWIVTALRSSTPAGKKGGAVFQAAAAPARPSLYVRSIGLPTLLVGDEGGRRTPVLGAPDIARGTDELSAVTAHLLGDDAALVVVPLRGRFTVQGISSRQPIDLEVLLGTSNVRPTRAVRYTDLGLPDGTALELELTDGRIGALRADLDGNGAVETVLAPTVDLAGPAAADVEGPEVIITADDGATGRAITVTARDAGSGVTAIYYSLDGVHFLPYRGAIRLPAGDRREVQAFADDAAGNRSSTKTLAVGR